MKNIFVVVFILMAGIAGISALSAEEVGKFSYKGAPENLNNDTIVVSDTMVAMSEKIYVMVENHFVTDSMVDTPSIFFVIDHSNSMSSANIVNGVHLPVNDQWGNRFTVTSAFIDSIYKRFPAAEIGFCIFTTNLYMRRQDDTMFDTINAAGYNRTNGAYLPLLRLNTMYTSTPYGATAGQRSGLDILKYYLQTDTVNLTPTYTDNTGYTVSRYVELYYHPVARPNGTNITIGFEAAKSAMQLSAHSRSNQYVIFLSDGLANTGGNGWITGANVPTTFTIFFTHDTAVPANIATMTTNIQNNLYSTTNPRSKAWPFFNSSYSALINFLMANVYSVINTPLIERPTRISIGSQSAVNWADSAFTLGRLLPLKGQTTPFTYVINYRQSKDGKAVKDTTDIVNFYVRTLPGTVLDTSLYVEQYWNRDLMFRFNGVPISTIDGTMSSVELLFGYSPGSANYNYTNIQVELSTTAGTVHDRETYGLNRIGTLDSFSTVFNVAVSSSPVQGNGILEHVAPDDTIIAVFRNSENPRLPLDTLRIACPVHIPPGTLGAVLDSAVTRDMNGNGLIDRIDLTFDKGAAINKNATGNFTITLGNLTFTADSIIPIGGFSYAVYIAEKQTNTTNPAPQTAWRPVISITGIPGVENVTGFLTTDGCPPVVWSVVELIISDNPAQDTVFVSMSEKITGPNGSVFSATNQPPQTFNVWTQDVNGTFISADTILSGIAAFNRIVDDSILVFTMSNGRYLSADNWVNLQWINPLIFDPTGNAPTVVNQKVRVIVEGTGIHVTIPVNPTGPTARHFQTGDYLEFKNYPEAINWVRDDNAGIVFSIQGLIVPTVDKDKVTGFLKIYDIAGNTVNWCSTDNVFGSEPAGSPPELNIYWNGMNRKGMMVAPGIYRSVIYISYPRSSRIRVVKLLSKIGIHR
jgi:hypothetical protein